MRKEKKTFLKLIFRNLTFIVIITYSSSSNEDSLDAFYPADLFQENINLKPTFMTNGQFEICAKC